MYQLMVASKSDLEIVFQLIEQRIEWMNRVGIKQWNETNYCEVYPKTYYERLMRQGRLYVLKSNQTHRVIGPLFALIKTSDGVIRRKCLLIICIIW